MRRKFTIVALGLVSIVLTTSTFAAETEPPASSEVTAAMQPYLDRYKLAGVIGIIADKSGKVHYKNLLGYADVEAKKPISEDNVFWIASMTKMFAGASIMMWRPVGCPRFVSQDGHPSLSRMNSQPASSAASESANEREQK